MAKVFTVGGFLFASVFLAFLGGVISARLLGPADRGVLAAIMTWPLVISFVADLGVPVVLTRQAATMKSTLPLVHAAVTGAFAVLLLMPLTLAVVIFGIPGSPTVNSQILGLAVMVTYPSLHTGFRMFGAISQGRGDFRHFNWTRIAPQIVFTSSVAILYLSDIGTLESVVVCFMLAGVGGLAVGCMPYLPEIARIRSLSAQAYVELAREGLPLHLGNLTPIDSLKLDLLVVSAVLSPVQTGFYAVAVATSNILRMPGLVFGTVGLSLTSAQGLTVRGLASARRLIVACGGLSLLMLGVALPSLTFLIPWIYGSEFGHAVLAAQVLSVGMVAAGMRQAIGDCLRGMGLGQLSTWAEIASWPAALAGFLIGLPLWGATGAALATTASFIVALIALLWNIRSCERVCLSDILIPTRDDRDLLFLRLKRIGSGV